MSFIRSTSSKQYPHDVLKLEQEASQNEPHNLPQDISSLHNRPSRVNISPAIHFNLPDSTFVVQSTAKKDYYWFVKGAFGSKLKLVSLKKASFEQASNDERFLWFVKENDSRIYSMMEVDGVNYVLDYHDSPLSLDVRRSLIVRKASPSVGKMQQYNIIQRSMISGLGTFVSIQCLGNKKFIQSWKSWSQGRNLIILKKKLVQNKDIGEWKIIPIVKQVYVQKKLLEKSLIRLPLRKEVSTWFTLIQQKVSYEDLSQKWDIMEMSKEVDEFGNNTIMRCILSNNINLLNYLIDHLNPQEYIHARNEFEQTALHLSAYRNDLNIVKKLCSLGADFHAMDKLGSTPFHDAVERDNDAVAKIFLEMDPKIIDIRDFKQKNIVHHAIQFKSLKCLKLILDCLSLSSDLLDAHDTLGFAALHYAANEAFLEGIHLLLDYGANLMVPSNENGNTPLHLAIRNMDPATIVALMVHCPGDKRELKIKNNYGISIRRASKIYQMSGLLELCVPGKFWRGISILNPVIRKAGAYFRIRSEKFDDYVLEIDTTISLDEAGRKCNPVVLKQIQEKNYSQQWTYWDKRILSLGKRVELDYITDAAGYLILVATTSHKAQSWAIEGEHIYIEKRKLYMTAIDDPFHKLVINDSKQGEQIAHFSRYQPNGRLITLYNEPTTSSKWILSPAMM